MTLSREQASERETAPREDTIIKEVDRTGDYIGITTKDSTGFSFKADLAPNTDIRPGQSLTFYGGLGGPVQGIDIDGVPVWFKAQRELDQEREEYRVQHRREKQEKFDADRSRLDTAYESLPRFYQLRIRKFRQERHDWRQEFEPYEMMVCQDAVRIGKAAVDSDDPQKWFDVFSRASWEEQKQLVSGLDNSHSGNSFGAAVSLARVWVKDPREVVLVHGALTPLTGCNGYGCPHPIEREILAEAGYSAEEIAVAYGENDQP